MLGQRKTGMELHQELSGYFYSPFSMRSGMKMKTGEAVSTTRKNYAWPLSSRKATINGLSGFAKVATTTPNSRALRNMIYTKKLSHQSGWGITPPANISTYAIRPFEKSVMSDHIGISTLAITADGYVIILHQNDKALTSTDRLMPSASGSVDFKDFHPNTDFRQTLITAAERELKEETNLTKDPYRIYQTHRFLSRSWQRWKAGILLHHTVECQSVRNKHNTAKQRRTER